MSDYKLVPVEPTDEMLRAANITENEDYHVAVYKAMLAAARPADELARLERDIAESWVFSQVARTDENFADWTDTKYLSEWSERYLELRGLLERHPDNPNLVRIKGRCDAERENL